MRSKIGLIKKVIAFNSHKYLGFPKTLPTNLTLGITYRCNSKCKTCNVWNFPDELKKNELTIEEYEKIFKSIGKNHVMWVTISGGEPFLRKDIVELCQVIDEELCPGIINIPTNSLLYPVIKNKVKEILNAVSQKTQLVINLSMDGIKEDDNFIRGVPHAWNFFVKNYRNLKKLQKKYENLELGIHSVISVYNYDKIPEIYEYVIKHFNPDSFITEVAENRVELRTMKDKITPKADDYDKAIQFLRKKTKDLMRKRKGLARITQAFRFEYYSIASRVLKEKRQVIPCFAGWASAQIDPFGNVWPCCIRAINYGNLRENNYDFRRVWYSRKASNDRKKIKNKECYCPLANAHYTNMLCNPKIMLKIIYRMIK